MRKSFLAPLLALALLAGCQRGADTQQPTSAAPDSATTLPAAEGQEKPKAMKLTPEDIAAIEATGRTGLWSDVTEACGKGRPPAATLTWNVKDQHDGRVVVYLIDKDGQPRNFGQGGPVGQKATGAWLRPGMTFRVRTLETKADLAELVIGEKTC